MLSLNVAPLTFGSTNDQPNIVFALIDDLGWSDTEYGGSGSADFGLIKTPNFVNLGAEAVKLERHYAYAWCAPSRSSLISGRLPVHVNVNHSNPVAYIESNPLSSGEGVPAGMTTIATKLKSVGYKTHYIGKWGVGFTWKGQNPMSRGFDSFFGYLHDSIDFWDQKLGPNAIEVPGGCEKKMRDQSPPDMRMAVDLIRNDAPAYGENSTGWIDYQFLEEAKTIIQNHPVGSPLFLLHSFHTIHAPLNAPAELYHAVEEYGEPPCADNMATCFLKYPIDERDRRSYAAMVTFTDKAVGEIVDALRGRGMWENTLMVVSSDNGGPQYMSPIGYQLMGSGNNLPLRGGKASEFEGGLRVNSFVTGGLLPSAMHGKTLDSIIHFADWYATFCSLAGANPHDDEAERNNLPPVDGMNQWPYLSGEVMAGPRKEMMISPATLFEDDDMGNSWKLLTGSDPGSINEHTVPGHVPFDHYAVGYAVNPVVKGYRGAVFASWDAVCGMISESNAFERVLTGEVTLDFLNNAPQAALDLLAPFLPVDSFRCPNGLDCRNGCLFNVKSDPNEENDVSAANPQVLARLMAKHANLSKPWTPEQPWGVFNPIRNGEDPRAAGTDDECSGDECTKMSICDGFLRTGFYSWAADANDFM
jgi:arylsulfatase I/J